MVIFSPYIAKILVLLAGSLVLLVAFLLSRRRLRLSFAVLFFLLVLIIPSYIVVEGAEQALESTFQAFLPERRPYGPLPWWGNLLSILVFLLPVVVTSTGVIMAAILWISGLKFFQGGAGEQAKESDVLSEVRKQKNLLPWTDLFLSTLVLAVTLYSLYWSMLWDNTTDSIGFIWLYLMLPAVFICALLLISRPAVGLRAAGILFAILIPLSLIGASVLAFQVDYRALTEARAGRVGRAIESYQARTGHYPQDLGQLSPRYLLTLPGPVIINGQDWCYQASDSGYQIGYVDRDHWSSPELFGHVFQTGGATQDIPPLCTREIAAIREERGW